ncbi:hypothetical protein GF415_00795 [Candidatus Micrarchaeota archaeon]|nr:hypothetical protein [Candidatus Micrarchaeota archaeon]
MVQIMNQPMLMKAAPGSGVPAGEAESRNGKKFEEMDKSGRGPNCREYWKTKGIDQKLAYARWLAKRRRITKLSEFRKIAPEPIYFCVRSSDENQRKAGLSPKQKRRAVESSDNPLTTYLREHRLLKKDIHKIPTELYVALCRKGVSIFNISSRRDFGRFFPRDAVFRNRNEELWDRVGLEDKRKEGTFPKKGKAGSRKNQDRKKPESKKHGDEFAGEDFLEFFDEQSMQEDAEKPEPASIFEDPNTLDSYLPEAPEKASRPLREFRGSPAGAPLLSDSSSLDRHEENIRRIFFKLVTWNRCPTEEKTRLKKTLFREVQKGGPERAARLICRVGMPLDEKDAAGQTLLHRAAENTNPRMLQHLLKIEGMDPNVQDGLGNTPLMAAATENNAAPLSLLRRRGAKLNQRNESGQTALMLAAWEGNTKSVKVLLSLGADYRCRDVHKNNAAEYAKMEGHPHIEKLIREVSRKKTRKKKGKSDQGD